jgi:3-dehydroquinate synthase
MKEIDIKVPAKQYPVYVGADIFSQFDKIILKHQLSRNLFFIIDTHVLDLHRTTIDHFVNNYKDNIYLHRFDSNETNKGIKSIEKIYSDLITHGFGRDTVIIAFGGGITGDIAGFAASTYARGVEFIQIPTTLLAAVDSSVGGKTGINFGETKNIIGAFYQPDFVLIDTNFLKTLPKEEIICGTGEIIKYAFLSDEIFYKYIERNFSMLMQVNDSITAKIIDTCIRFKGDVVAKDEKEKGLRKILNLGHTFAHAIEIEQKYKIKHGQAVVIGLVCALELSKSIGLISNKIFKKYIQLPLLLKDKIKIDTYDASAIHEIMKRDKKNRDNKIKLILVKEIGNLAVDCDVDDYEIEKSISVGMNCFLK